MTSHRHPLHPSRRVRRPIRSLLPQCCFRRSLEGRRTRRGARNLCRTFPAPPHSEPSVPNLPGHHRPLRPQPSGSAGGRLRAPLNGASGAGGLRCWRDLPNDNPRSSAPLALHSGPVVKATHPSAQKNSRGTTIFLAPGRVLAGGGRRPCPGVDATCGRRWPVCTASDLDQGSLGWVGTLNNIVSISGEWRLGMMQGRRVREAVLV